MDSVIKLGDSLEVEKIGGKAAALAKMLAAGFNVPAGFSIHSPDTKPESILSAFDSLNTEYVAVRSSAVAEDGQDAAWAGQFETFLNVKRPNLINKVRACFESGQAARAKAYASQRGLAESRVSVLVQVMIQGRVSGIAFSVNPVNQSRQELVIEAALGLNEAIVSGEVTPDTFILSKPDGNVISASIARQTKKLVLAKGANNWLQIDVRNPKLTDKELKKVQEQAIRLEDYFGFPIDMEWTFGETGLFILQCRPITTLK